MAKKEMAPVASANAANGPKDKNTTKENIRSSTQKGKTAIGSAGGQQPLGWPSSFCIGPDGIYKKERDEKSQTETTNWVFSLVIVEARTRDLDDQNWGLLLKIQTPSGRWHSWAMPMSLLSTNAYKETLLSLGMQIEHWAMKLLHQYLMSAKPQKFITCVERVGWYGKTYVLPDTSYGPSGKEQIIMQSSTPVNIYRVSGSLEEWQEHIGRYCIGNSRLIFSVSLAFAAVMLKVVGMNGAGFHIVGMSSMGKSITLLVAASVCGGGGENGFVRRWRTTGNALESWAMMHNNNLLLLDEISQVSAKEAAEIAYMLANGQGKGRAGKDGVAKQVHEWRLLFLSNGEISLEQKLKEDGQRYMAGQDVRVIHIPADAQHGYGIFENLHEFPDGKAFAEYLQETAQSLYGTPLRAFLERLCLNLNEHRQFANSLITYFEKECCPTQASEQVRRAAKYFALVAASGELAIQLGTLTWPKGAVIEAAKQCMRDWILFRGGMESGELREAISRVRDFISRHNSRFSPLDKSKTVPIPNCAGYRIDGHGTSETLFLIYPSVFKEEICAGGNHNAIARYLAHAGYLEKDSEGKPSKGHHVPEFGKTLRLYTIRASILEGEDFNYFDIAK